MGTHCAKHFINAEQDLAILSIRHEITDAEVDLEGWGVQWCSHCPFPPASHYVLEPAFWKAWQLAPVLHGPGCLRPLKSPSNRPGEGERQGCGVARAPKVAGALIKAPP